MQDPLFDEPQYARVLSEGTFCDVELVGGLASGLGCTTRIWIGDPNVKPVTPFEACILEAKGEIGTD